MLIAIRTLIVIILNESFFELAAQLLRLPAGIRHRNLRHLGHCNRYSSAASAIRKSVSAGDQHPLDADADAGPVHGDVRHC